MNPFRFINLNENDRLCEPVVFSLQHYGSDLL